MHRPKLGKALSISLQQILVVAFSSQDFSIQQIWHLYRIPVARPEKKNLDPCIPWVNHKGLPPSSWDMLTLILDVLLVELVLRQTHSRSSRLWLAGLMTSCYPKQTSANLAQMLLIWNEDKHRCIACKVGVHNTGVFPLIPNKMTVTSSFLSSWFCLYGNCIFDFLEDFWMWVALTAWIAYDNHQTPYG